MTNEQHVRKKKVSSNDKHLENLKSLPSSKPIKYLYKASLPAPKFGHFCSPSGGTWFYLASGIPERAAVAGRKLIHNLVTKALKLLV